MSISDIKDKVLNRFQGQYIRNIGVLVGGTAFSQLLAILALPFLTRIYTPEDFGVLAVYTSLLSIISVVACLRFEIAIPLPKKEKDAIALLFLAVLSVIVVTLLTILGVSLFSDLILQATDYKLFGFLWLIPIGVFFAGIYSTLQYWATRKKAFPLIAKTRMTQAISGNGTQLTFGFLNFGAIGLLLGQLLNVGAGIWGLSRYILKNHLQLLRTIKMRRLKAVAKRYDRFPKYSTWEAFANTGAIQIPIILIAYYAIDAEAGFIMLAMRLLSAPMGLIGGAVSQVYLAEGANHYHNGTLKQFTYQTIKNLAKVGILPLLFAAITAPILIPFIFGEEWTRTGILISWMAPWFFMQFISSPVSMALHITDNQKIALILQILGFFLRVGFVIFSGIYFENIIGEIYAISGLVFYLVYLLVVVSISTKKVNIR